MTSRAGLRVASVALIALIAVSLVFPALPVQGGSRGIVLALFKVAALAFILERVVRVHVYSLQWSSMFILLFVTEGLVRAASDRPPSSWVGAVEAVFATVYFVAVLRYLRPLKKAAARPKAK